MRMASLKEVERFSAEKMQKCSLFETDRLFCDVYCLEPGQFQKIHAHERSDKIYIVMEGRLKVAVGDEEKELGPGEAAIAGPGEPHGLRNDSPERAKALVFMTPRP